MTMLGWTLIAVPYLAVGVVITAFFLEVHWARRPVLGAAVVAAWPVLIFAVLILAILIWLGATPPGKRSA